MKKGRLSFLIFFVIAGVCLLEASLVIFYVSLVNKKLSESNAGERLKNHAFLISEKIDSFLTNNEAIMRALLSAYDIPSGDKRRNIGDMEYLFAKDPLLFGLSVINQEGAEIRYLGGRPKPNYTPVSPSIIDSVIKNGNVFRGLVRKNPAKNQLLTSISFRMPNIFEGINNAVISAEFDMTRFGNSLSDSEQKDISILIFTRSGLLIYSSQGGLSVSPGDTYKKERSAVVSAAVEDRVLLVNNKNALGAALINSMTGWIIYAEQNLPSLSAVFLNSFEFSPGRLPLFALVVLLPAFIVSFWFFYIVIRPIRMITKAVDTLESENEIFLPPLPLPDNEIGALTISFAKLFDTLKIKTDAMEHERKDLEEINQSLELRVGSRTKELKTALNEMIKKERLAAIGQMASIVSHEIRNPLTVMSNSLYLIKAFAAKEADAKMLKNISIMEQEIKRANGIIEEILGYARSRSQIFSVVDISAYIKDIMASSSLPASITFHAEYFPQPLLVNIDTEEIRQAVRNIINNAAEVLPDGGKISVKTECKDGKAVLSIRDDGPGIPKDIQNKIFNPFFTTKARGTGLGLAVVKKAAERNNADIIVQSAQNKGTKISMVFNLADMSEDKKGES
ncbi:MAG: hypothetical protein LBG46_05650 [Elusimicrobiota bacterium]|jgi:signal transduction histidine kinase|nr:hypothetical protein [Elusimicrobiota bacterium]